MSGPGPTDMKGMGNGISRRDFLRRAAGAAAITVAAGGLGLALLDRHGPKAESGAKVAQGLGDYTIPEFSGAKARMAIVRGKPAPDGHMDRAAMFERAMGGLAGPGGLENFIKRGDRVLIKVNAAFATSPMLGATTHPDLIVAVAGLCLKAGAAYVSITDNPIHSPESCFELSGIADAARQSGSKIILPREELFTPVSLPGGTLIQNWPVLTGALKGATKVIAMSPVKDHHRAGASLSLKNFYGFLGGRRNVFHQDINGVIAELALLIRPTLIVLDGTVSMMSNGPTGGSLSDLKATGMLAVTTDPVAADSFGMELLGRGIDQAPYIRLAEAAGAGRADYKALNPQLLDLGA